VKETLTFQMPVVLPLLGFRLSMIYVTAFWLTGVLKLVFVLVWGRFNRPLAGRERDVFASLECDPADPECVKRGFCILLADTWHARKKMFFRMMGLLAAVTLVIQVLTLSCMLTWIEMGISPMTSALNLPSAVIGPITTYLFSPTVGITYMSNLMTQGSVSGYEAITALMAVGLLNDSHYQASPHPAAVYGDIRGEKRGCYLRHHHGVCHVVQTFLF